ncbi:MAG: chemotaxis protein CheA, partial [Burkholderiales bacterium PBB5]
MLLAAGDALKALLARHQGTGDAVPDTTDLLFTIKTLCDGGKVDTVANTAPSAAGAPAAAPVAAPVAAGTRLLALTVTKLDDASLYDSLVELFKEITGLGDIEPLDPAPAADGSRRFKITTTSSDADLLDLFTFHVPRDAVALEPLNPPAEATPAPEGSQEVGYGFFDNAPGAPRLADAGPAAANAPVPSTELAAAKPTAIRAAAPRAEGKAAAALESATLRVSVEKVDQLINLVGELVITQAMLAQNSKGLDAGLSQQMASGLADLERNTRDLQEAVMSIRMIP